MFYFSVWKLFLMFLAFFFFSVGISAGVWVLIEIVSSHRKNK